MKIASCPSYNREKLLNLRKKPFFYGWWIVLSCAITSFWAGGIFYGVTAFINPIVKELGWTYLAVSLAASLRSVETGIMAPVAGFVSDKFGPRRITFLSGLIGGTGFLLLSQIRSLSMYYVSSLILFIGFTGLGQAVTTTAVANWFKKKIGLATGFAIAGYGAGGILLPFIVWLIAHCDWRPSLVILGIGTWLIVLPASLLLKHRPEKYGYFPDGESSGEMQVQQEEADKAFRAEGKKTASQALRTKAFWFLSSAFAIQFLVLNAITLHVIPHYASIGVPERLGAMVAMFIPISSILGRLSFGWLGDVFGRKYVLAIVFFLQAVGLTWFCFGRAFWQFMAFLLFYGPAYGGGIALRSAAVREYFGRRAFGSIHGMIITIHTVGGIIGPAFAGWVFDINGSYRMAWLILTLATLSAVPVILAIPSPYPKASHRS